MSARPMRDSGVEWIGEIPAHWEVVNLGRILVAESVKGYPELQLLSITREQGIIVRDTSDSDANHNFIPDDLSGYKRIKVGQFGMNKMKAWQGSYGISAYEGIVSPAYYIFDLFGEFEASFFHWAIRCKLYVAFFGQSSDGVRVGQWDLSKSRMREIPFVFPPLPEQRAIATFLDRKTSQIDQIIEKKERLIKLLEEKRSALITQAVTRGLDPDVPMRDSGVEWIGEIPEHWEVVRFRNSFKCRKGLTITKASLVESGIPVINYGQVHSKYGFEFCVGRDELPFVSEDFLTSNPSALLQQGDLVFADTSEDIQGSGNFSQLVNTGKVFAGYHTIIASSVISDLDQRFIAYLITSDHYRHQIRSLVKGVKVYSVSQGILNQTDIWLPPIPEQRAIATFLDRKTSQIDQIIEKSKAQIEKLKEYRQALITSAVTGKIDLSEQEATHTSNTAEQLSLF